MKNSLKLKTLTTIIMIIMVITMSTAVNAVDTDNYSVGASLTSNAKLQEGETINVSVNLTSVNAGEGIDTITAELEYDKNVLEPITVANFTGSNSWTPSYAETSNVTTFIKTSKVKSAETVATISFKVKTTISVDSTTIKLKDIVASGGRVVDGGTGDINVRTAVLTISKTKDSTSTTEDGKTPSYNEITSNTTIKTQTSKDNTTTKTKLPKTGIEQYGLVSVVVVIIGIFSFVLYKKISKDVK